MQQPSVADPATAPILKAAAALGVLGQNGSTAPKILSTLYDPETTPTRIANVIGLEPGLTVRVLRVANSSLYGLRQKIATIDRAVLVLGLDAVRSVAAAACFDRGVLSGARNLAIDVDALQLHSLATALAAEMLAALRSRTDSSAAFVAGLLHDLGVMIQLRLDGDDVRALLDRARDSGATAPVRAPAPRVPHEHCSSVTLAAWGLPQRLVAATEFHHSPSEAPEEHRATAAVVALADRMTFAVDMGFECGGDTRETDDELLALAGITTDDRDAVASTLRARVSAMQNALAEP